MECIIAGVVLLFILAISGLAISAGSSGQVSKLTQRFDAFGRRLDQLERQQGTQGRMEERLSHVEAEVVRIKHSGTWEGESASDPAAAPSPPADAFDAAPTESSQLDDVSPAADSDLPAEDGRSAVPPPLPSRPSTSMEPGEGRDDSALFTPADSDRLGNWVSQRRGDPSAESQGHEGTAELDADITTPAESITPPELIEFAESAVAGQSIAFPDLPGQGVADGETSSEDDADAGESSSADQPASKKTTFEERLGARLFVWIGAIALALAGTYLVKYGMEQGILTPTVRMVLGGLFGFALLGAGEFMRGKSMRIAQGLSAAGVADLFAVTLSATNHHGMLPPTVGFICMALVTAVAVFLSIRQGWFVAMLGMVGGFLTPVLVGMEDQHPAQLFAYLLILEVGLVVITRKQGWWHLSALTMLGAMGWATKWTMVNLADPVNTQHTVWLGLFILGSIAAFVCASLPKSQGDEDGAAGKAFDPLHIVSWIAALSGLALIGRLIHAGNFAAGDWVYLGLLGAGAMVLGRLDRRYLVLPWVTCTATLALIVGWHWSASDSVHAGDAFQFVTLGMGLLYGIGGWCCIWRRQAGDAVASADTGAAASASHKPILWAGLSVVASLAYMLVTYWAMPSLQTFAWWQVSVAIGAVMVVAAVPVYRRRDTMPHGNVLLAVFATGATAFFALAIPFELEKQWITVAWALMIPAIAIIEIRLKVPALRRIVAALAGVVAVRLLLNPAVLTYPIEGMVIWNWLLYGYGVPMLCFGITAWIYNRFSVSLIIGEMLEALAVAFGFALITLQIRYGFHGQLSDTSATLHESGTYTIAWLIACIGLMLADRRWQRPIFNMGAKLVGGFALGAAVYGSLTTLNPIVTTSDVGPTLGFNLLLFDYALPTVLTALIGYLFFQQRERVAAMVAWAATGVFAFAWMTFTVRHGFHRGFERDLATLTEWATYSTAWLLIGVILLAVAQRFKQPILRHVATGMLTITALIALAAQLGGRNPLITHEVVSGSVIANGLLYIYGVPALLTGLMAWQYRRAGDRIAMALAGCVSLVFTFMLVTLQIRHGFHLPNFAGETSLVEWGTYLNAWLVMSLGLFVTAHRKQSHVIYIAASAIALVALGTGGFVLAYAKNPMLTHEAMGGVAVLNWLLYAYGGPASLAGGIAVWLAKVGRKDHGVVAAISAIVTAFFMVTLMVRHGFHSPNLVGDASLVEHATYTIAWLGMGIVMLAAARRWAFKSLVRGGMTVCCIAMAHGLTVLGLTENPMRGEYIIDGGLVLNDLLYIYGLPALLAGIASWQAGRHGEITIRRFAGIAAILFAFALCSLEVRHAFAPGGDLSAGDIRIAEQYAYSAVWTVFGVILLVLAIWKRGHVLRYASLVVMMLAVGKVFLFDAAHLQDLYRVFSFLGLGVSLLVLAFLYQKFVFRRAE